MTATQRVVSEGPRTRPAGPRGLEPGVIEPTDRTAELAVILRPEAHGSPEPVDVPGSGGWRARRADRGGRD